MVKRHEVKVFDAGSAYWRPCEVIGTDGADDDQYVVEYTLLDGTPCEDVVDESRLRLVEAEITDELLREAAAAAVRHIQQHVIALDGEVLEGAGRATLQGLRLYFSYPN